MQEQTLEYAGFWIRTGAAIIDTILIMLITYPLLIWIYGMSYIDSGMVIAGTADFFISWVSPAIVVIVFWIYKQSPPGKMVVSVKIVDATSGNAPTTGQCIGRYFRYFPALLPLGLGILWVACDKKTRLARQTCRNCCRSLYPRTGKV